MDDGIKVDELIEEGLDEITRKINSLYNLIKYRPEEEWVNIYIVINNKKLFPFDNFSKEDYS